MVPEQRKLLVRISLGLEIVYYHNVWTNLPLTCPRTICSVINIVPQATCIVFNIKYLDAYSLLLKLVINYLIRVVTKEYIVAHAH